MTPVALRVTHLSLLLSALVLGLVGAAVPADRATAGQADEEDLVEASLSVMEPAAPQPGDTLVLAGMLRNASSEPLHDVTVFPRYSRDPLEERGDIRRVADDPTYRSGRRDNRYRRSVTETLQPSASIEWRLELPVDAIGLGEPGVYVVGIDVRANRDDGLRVTAGQARSVLPWLRDENPPPVSVALLWPLAATHPSLAPDGAHLDDQLATEIASGGSLRELVTAANGTPVSWLVEPDLLTTLDSMTGGYTVQTTNGKQPGVGAKDAASWLTTYQAATAGAQILGLPYASPDVSALARSDPGRATDVVRSAAAASRDDLVKFTPEAAAVELVSRPAGGAVSPEGLEALAAGGTETVVVSESAVRPGGGGSRVRLVAAAADPDGGSGSAGVDAIRTDAGLDEAIADAASARDAAAGSLELRQRMLAETALAGLEAKDAGTGPTPLVAAAPQEWRPDPLVAHSAIDAWTNTNWIQPVPLSALPESPARVRPQYTDDDRAAELDAAYLARTAQVATLSDRFYSTLVDPADAAETLERSRLRMVSASWRAYPRAATRYVNNFNSYLDERLDEIGLRVPDSVTLSSSSGRFPVTVENGLDRAVQVRIRLTPANRDRLTTQPLAPVVVGAGEKATVDVYARATSNGRTPVDVALATPDGTPLGEAEEIVVIATDYGTIGWIVIAGGSALLLGAALFRLTRRGGRRAEAEPSSPVAEEEEVW